MKSRFVIQSNIGYLGITRFMQGVVYLEIKNMKETNLDSPRIRLISAVQVSDQDQDQVSDQDQDQKSESLARREERSRLGRRK